MYQLSIQSMVILDRPGFSCEFHDEDSFGSSSSNDEIDFLSPSTPIPYSAPNTPEAPAYSPISPCASLSQLSSDCMSIDSETAAFHGDVTCTAIQGMTTSTAETTESSQEKWLGFKVVGDNTDKNIRPRHQSLEARTKSLHYFHAFAALDRINPSCLSEQRPNVDPMTLGSCYLHMNMYAI